MRRILNRFLLVLLAASILPLGSPQAAKKKETLTAETLAANPDVVEMRRRVAASPEDSGLLNDLANLYARKGWNELAIEAYREALHLDADAYMTWTNMGTVHSKMGTMAQAAKAFRRAIAIQPRAALAHYNLGVVLDRQGLYDEALKEYKTAVTFDPSLLDAAANPQVVNNKHLTAIRLLNYLEEVGASSLPLEDTETDPGIDDQPAPPDGSETDTPAAVGRIGKGRRWQKNDERAEPSASGSLSHLSFASDHDDKVVLGTLIVQDGAAGIRLLGYAIAALPRSSPS